jgi:hypothetical protein
MILLLCSSHFLWLIKAESSSRCGGKVSHVLHVGSAEGRAPWARLGLEVQLHLCPRECKRTQGVSTTDLVGRMLLVTKAHHSSQVSLQGQGTISGTFA